MKPKGFVLKLSGKLMSGAAFFLLAFVLFLVMVGSGLGRIGKKSAVFQQEQARGNTFINELLVAANTVSVQYMKIINSQKDGISNESTLNVSELQKVIVKGATSTDLPDYFKESISEIATVTKQINSQTAGSDGATIPDALNRINILIQGLITKNVSYSEEFGKNMAAEQGKIRGRMILWMTITFVVVLFFFVMIIRTIRIRVDKTLKFADKIAEGDLTALSSDNSQDEIGQINDALERLKDKLREILNSVKDISLNIMNASAEFNSGSQLISGGASAQASSSEEISAAMEQIAEVIKQSADNANETGIIAKNAFEGIQHGANQVEAALSVIEDIAHKNSVIGEISYQTKILSINASVEAARAAELGRGFAVVAEEVKRLAETTQSSAFDISHVSKKGVDLARKSANELRSLVAEFQRTSELVNQIAEAGNEHINTIVQINYSLQDLNNITQQNASSAEELAASSDELVKLTQSLDQLISFFKLEEEFTNEEVVGQVEFESNENEARTYASWESKSFNNDDSNLVVENVEPFQFLKGDHGYRIDEDDQIVESVQPEPIIEKIETPKIEKPSKPALKEEKAKVHPKGVRINLTDNDDLDSQFEKMK